jgi:ATP-dependent helicase HrpA
VLYGRIDPALAHQVFLRKALVEGEWDADHAFLAANANARAEVERLEAKARRRDLLTSDGEQVAWFAARVPADVVSGAHFDRWWKDARRADPDLLTLSREALAPDAAAAVRGRPDTLRRGDRDLRLSYRFEPGADDDGATLHVPLDALAGLTDDGLDWHLAGFRLELVTALLRGLPKELRRELVPVPDLAAAILARVRPGEGPLTAALAREVKALRGVTVPPQAWPTAELPSHLRLRFAIAADGEVLAAGRDLDALKAQLRGRLRAQLTAAAPQLERTGLTAWTLGTLPRTVATGGVTGYPALVDEGGSVGVKVLETAHAQHLAMAAGTRRLLLLTAPPVLRRVRDGLSRADQLALTRSPHGGVAALLDDAVTAAVDRLVGEEGGPAWDAAGFQRLGVAVARRLADATLDVARTAARILDQAAQVERVLAGLQAAPLAAAKADLEAQLRRLVYPGFLARTGAFRLADVERYLRAAVRRAQRLSDGAALDRQRLDVIHDLELEHARVIARWPAGRAVPPALAEVPWLLEELRVSTFAQALGTREPVSPKRIRRVLADAEAAAA